MLCTPMPRYCPTPCPARATRRPALEAALRRHLRGEVRFDSGSRALYATDGSNYRQVPIGVVLPRDKEDVLATVALCRDHHAPLLARGGGTSLAGQCCNAAVILDFSKYMARILEIDPERRIARVQPGVVLDHLRGEAEKHHLTFAPDPATHDRCTLGGMIGNNSCGVHSIMAGKTDDNIEALEVLTYDGQRLHVGATSDDDFARISKRRRTPRPDLLRPQATRRPLRRSSPPPVSQHPAPRLRIQPQPPAARKRLPRRARAGRLRRHVRHDSRGYLPPR